MNGEPKTNDQLIDDIIIDVNRSIKELLAGNSVTWCGLMYQTIQKLACLKKGVAADMRNREEQIERLKVLLRESGNDVQTVPIQEFLKGGDDGGQ